MKPNRVNIKHHDKGVITWGVDTSTWMPSITERGWGNGYIAVPVDHPFMQNIHEEIRPLWSRDVVENILKREWTQADEDKKINITYNQLNENYPINSQEWTYSEPEEIDGKQYYVFGFDTLHSWNNELNSSEDIVMSMIEGYVSVVNN